jgi:ribosome biogenesis GTPase
VLDADEYERLAKVGFRAEDIRGLSKPLVPGQSIARIVAQHRSGFRVHDGASEIAAYAPAALHHAADSRDRPAVGDFVVLDPGDPPKLARLLPRRGALTRGAAGEAVRAQTIAANIDTVVIVCGLDLDYNARRIERYLVLARASGAQPLVLLTKPDLCPEWEDRVREIAALAGPGVEVIALNARELESAAKLAPYAGTGQTVVLVGSSGAGKSTLTNTLLGIARQKTQDVRAHDSRGRHTTTHRALIQLPSGGCIIDTPGMRELKLTGDEDTVAAQFEDIEALAAGCRFRDCRHRGEPGCAVEAAIEAGTLERHRLEHFLKLGDEVGRTAEAAAASRKANEKVMGRALNKRLVDKYGSR